MESGKVIGKLGKSFEKLREVSEVYGVLVGSSFF